MTYDVVIVGAGIAGMACGLMLKKGGLQVKLIEASSYELKESFYCELLSPNAQNQFNLLFGNKFLDNLQGIPIHRTVSKWNSDLISVKKHAPEFSPKAIKKNHLIAQTKLELHNQGLHIQSNTRAKKIINEKYTQKVIIEHQGNTQTLECKLVILATGRKAKRITDANTLYKPQYLACGFLGHCSQQRYTHDFFMEGICTKGEWWYALPYSEISFFLNVSIPAPLFKSSQNREALLQSLFYKTSLFKEVLAFEPPLKTFKYGWASSHDWGEIQGENWVCIGDAAYVHHPLSGRGIDFAMYSARLLSDKILDYGFSKGLNHYGEIIENHAAKQMYFEKQFILS